MNKSMWMGIGMGMGMMLVVMSMALGVMGLLRRMMGMRQMNDMTME
jgi:hypothetical protein